jgi:hypothetical protein
MTGIITLSLVPLRESDSERSEMGSQLLFGERVEIVELRDRWLFVRNLSDNYTGWVDRKMIQILTDEEEIQLAGTPFYCVQVPLSVCDKTTSNEKMFLPGGSMIAASADGHFPFRGEEYRIKSTDLNFSEKATGSRLVQLATQYLNAPYLWGGKSAMGIDCTGFVQILYAMCDIQLARDADKQVESGRVIDFLSEAKAGDLAFFENAEGKITHVGMLLNSQQLIHASGWVKIETLDSQGIISAQTGAYTHTLRLIKRLI